MKSQAYDIVRYDADENKVFDWANLEEHTIEDENGNITQEHLYVKTIFIGVNDNIDNYVEIEAPIQEAE